MIFRHIVLPLFKLGNNRFVTGILTFISDFGVLIPLLILYPLHELLLLLLFEGNGWLFLNSTYRPRLESTLFLSSDLDDSDFVLLVSVILTKRFKKGDPVDRMDEFIVLLPGEDNYAIATKSFTMDADDKEFLLTPKEKESK